MKLRLVLCAAIFVLAAIIGVHEVKASPQIRIGSPCVISIPAEWGDFKGISKFGLVFEEQGGTLRIIDQMPCDTEGGYHGVPNVSVEVRRK